MKETGNFFTEILGFTVEMDTDNYAILRKDHLTIHVLPAGKDIGQMEFYLEVDNIDALWASIRDKLIGIQVKEPFNQEYGMREVHIAIPQTNALLFIGQQLDA